MSYATSNNVSDATSSRPSTSSSFRREGTPSRSNLSLETATTQHSPRRTDALSPARNMSPRTSSSSSPNGKLPPKSPLHRSPSSMSQTSRSSTPTLLRKASMNSLHGVGGITPSRSSSSRRSSSTQFTNASTMVGRSPLAEVEDPVPPPPKYTPESVARNYFAAELATHEGKGRTMEAETVVILHDACYGHRYSRPRTSKATLSSIVERPERISACILGLSSAYIWLGGRHADGPNPPDPRMDPSEIPAIPFKIRKTARRLPLASQAVTNVHGVKWMEELKVMCDNAESRLAGSGKELKRPDMPRSATEKPSEFHEGDLYLCSESLEAMEGAMGAVCEGVDAVFEGSASANGPFRTFVVIRPPGHHCAATEPSGFCWVNNVLVGIQHAALTHGLTHAAIIDFDLHHGDGSQALAWESNKRAAAAGVKAPQWKKTSIGYFSLHDINSYPCEQGDEEKVTSASVCVENAHNQSVWNVHLQPWKSEAEFWELYEGRYSVILTKARNYLRTQTERLRSSSNGPKPKGAIFLSAGFDASEWESSGMQRHKVNVPTEFYARLTRDVVRLAAEEGCAVDGRVISVLEGGYSDRALSTGVLSHLSGMTTGEAVVIKKEPSPNGLAYEMVQKIGAFNGHQKRESVTLGTLTYDPSWWSVQRLEQLDAVLNPGPVEETKKPRDLTPPTYSSPTQSFIAKVNTTARRSSYGVPKMTNGSSTTNSRPPSPPPPEVDWTIAVCELSKLLIPSDRTTTSCKPEDLAAEATRIRRERQSVVHPLPSDAELSNSLERMTLRKTRQTTKPLPGTAEENDLPKAPSRASRRRTDIGVATIPVNQVGTDKNPPIPVPAFSYTKTAPTNRRASIASTTGSVISDTPAPAIRGKRVPSSGTCSTVSRPGTSQSIRPESSASVRQGATASGPTNRTRKPAQPRAAGPVVPRPRKKSPLNEGSNRDGTIDKSEIASSGVPPGNSTVPQESSTLAGRQLSTTAAQESKSALKVTKSRTKAIHNGPTNGIAPGANTTPAVKAPVTVTVDNEMDGITSSLGGMVIAGAGSERGPSSSNIPFAESANTSVAPVKKKYMIDLRQLGLRAKDHSDMTANMGTAMPDAAPKSANQTVTTPETPNAFTAPSSSNTDEQQALLQPKIEQEGHEPQAESNLELNGLGIIKPETSSPPSVVQLALNVTNSNSKEENKPTKAKKTSKSTATKPVKPKTTRKDPTSSNRVNTSPPLPPATIPSEPITSPSTTNTNTTNTLPHTSTSSLPPLPPSSPIGPPQNLLPTPATTPTPSDPFIPYNPAGPTNQNHINTIRQEPLQWLPPNTSTPSPMKRREILPVFSSTGVIPFGVARSNGVDGGGEREREREREREIPETPSASQAAEH